MQMDLFGEQRWPEGLLTGDEITAELGSVATGLYQKLITLPACWERAVAGSPEEMGSATRRTRANWQYDRMCALADEVLKPAGYLTGWRRNFYYAQKHPRLLLRFKKLYLPDLRSTNPRFNECFASAQGFIESMYPPTIAVIGYGNDRQGQLVDIYATCPLLGGVLWASRLIECAPPVVVIPSVTAQPQTIVKVDPEEVARRKANRKDAAQGGKK